MNNIKTKLLSAASALLLAGCSIVGESGVEEASYTVNKSVTEPNIEVRTYVSLILVSTVMPEGERNAAFRRLFGYITGDNVKKSEIAMTAPVFMNEESKGSTPGTEISMTAPVFMDKNQSQPTMSFVMPDSFTLETTPQPTNDKVWVHEKQGYQVAAITFSGTLSDSNVEEHTQLLTKWLADNGYQIDGQPVQAAYNGPMTLPWFRKNEIIIPVK